MSAPERIWMTGEDHGASWPGSFRAFRCSSLDHSNDDGPNPDYPEYIRKDASDAAIAAARAEGVREGMLKAAGYADNWLATFGQAAIKHTPAQEYACDAVADIADAIRAAAEAQP